jgi:acetoin utilization deacetylase AcuC-like enzyme
MEVVVATHRAVLEHDTGPHHPEGPERVESVTRGLHGSGLEVVDLEAPLVDMSDLVRVHDPSYVEAVERFCRLGGGLIDTDTVASPATWEAALRSAGAATMLAEQLEPGSDATGFAVTRPPGHHALRDRAMGFCFFNNIAVAASRLRDRRQRVAILDWDVHHGNGTQAILGDDPGVLYVSIHQDPFYPFEGHLSDIDRMAPGTNVNLPLPAGTGGDIYRRAWEELVLPVLKQFDPDRVLVSAGYDAHVDDPLADMALIVDDFGWMAAGLGDMYPPGSVVMVLEGGYDLSALEHSAAATVLGLSGETGDGTPFDSPDRARVALDRIAAAVGRHWKV